MDGGMDGWRRDGEGGTMLIIHPAQPHRRYPKQRSRPRVWPLVEGQEWGAHHRPINAKPGPQKAGPGLLIKESQTCASWSNFPNREGGCPGCPMARSRATFDRIPYVETVSLNFEWAAALRIPVGQAGPRVRWWKGRVFWPAGSTGREFNSSGWACPGGPGLRCGGRRGRPGIWWGPPPRDGAYYNLPTHPSFLQGRPFNRLFIIFMDWRLWMELAYVDESHP
jgi:hypothetical protein